jgi:hypothetical protein
MMRNLDELSNQLAEAQRSVSHPSPWAVLIMEILRGLMESLVFQQGQIDALLRVKETPARSGDQPIQSLNGNGWICPWEVRECRGNYYISPRTTYYPRRVGSATCEITRIPDGWFSVVFTQSPPDITHAKNVPLDFIPVFWFDHE